MQALQRGAQPDGVAGVSIGNSDNEEAIDGDHFVGQHVDADAGEDLAVMGGVAKLIMVAGREVAAQGRSQRTQGLSQGRGVGHCAVE